MTIPCDINVPIKWKRKANIRVLEVEIQRMLEMRTEATPIVGKERGRSNGTS